MSSARRIRRAAQARTTPVPVRFGSKAELFGALKSGAFAGRALQVLVEHDPWCSPSSCRCSPNYQLVELTPENYAAARIAAEDWRRQTSS